MNLNILWFVLIGVLYAGYFFLEGFDFGVGMLLHLVGKKDVERRAVINTIGPHWDGNEVWLILAGGATFAAFPNWYGTMFSGFYLGMFFLLLALIFRGVAFEFRSKNGNPKWRYGWDAVITISSLLSPVLLGIVFTNLVIGVPIDGNQHFTGNFWTLTNPISILGGLALAGIFLLHGGNFLTLKLTDDLRNWAEKWSRQLWFITFLMTGIYLAILASTAPAFLGKGMIGWIAPILVLGALVLTRVWMAAKRERLSFAATGLAIILLIASFFIALYPNVMISSTSPDFNLTIYNASSSPYTLKVMTIVAAVMVPVVLAYQIWTYWVFRKRVKADPDTLTY